MFAVRIVVGGLRLVALLSGPNAFLQKLLGPVELDLSQYLRRLSAFKRAFRLFNRCLKRIRLDTVEGLPFFYEFAFLEQDGFEIAGDASSHFDPVDSFDPANKVFRLGSGLLLRNDSYYLHRLWRCLLRRCFLSRRESADRHKEHCKPNWVTHNAALSHFTSQPSKAYRERIDLVSQTPPARRKLKTHFQDS